MNKMRVFDEERNSPRRRFKIYGKDICYYREVSSTNKIARDMAARGEPEGTIVMCAYQSSGVGRMRRPWVCPSGAAITMSMILRPRLDAKAVPLLTLLCGVAVADAVSALSVGRVGIKWPNDVLVGGKKICGILAQSGFMRDKEPYVVMGIGLNVNQTAGQLPEECRETATSLRIEKGERLSRLDVLGAFVRKWDERYAAFQEKGYAYLRGAWLERDVTLGRTVSIAGEGGGLVGVAKDISERGGLIVEFSDGGEREYLAEDLSLGRDFYG
ncbi:MAG: biotin--[acetyl-CoA-carboxylase] ligase [Clostridiales Family XIII bacterium]|jgi:BirA family biotin operon repressor/biotin-[acetyl-CoA-carboxylase] ligase|nr:biotin--[acetyl-CoA-carboxylase] ligase [Clostridiales Family XIII bacterium]